MGGNDRKTGFGTGGSGPSEEELAARLRALDRRLDERKQKQVAIAEKGRPGSSGFARALSLPGTFISAILVGAGIGWGIDRFFGVTPWGIFVFTLLGFCAGVLNVLRMTGHMSPAGGKRDGADLDK